jgi:hypothetical protein
MRIITSKGLLRLQGRLSRFHEKISIRTLNIMIGEHSMKRGIVSGLFCLFFLLTSSVQARAGVSFEIIPGVGYLTGYSTFQIGDVPVEDDFVTPPREPYFPISELTFPLMSGIETLDARVSLGPLSIEGGVKQNFTHHPGMTRDYDWGMPYYNADGPSGPGWYVTEITDGTSTSYPLDVESKSRTRLEARIWNAKASWRFYTFSYDYYDTDWVTGSTTHNKGDFSMSLGLGYEKRRFDFDVRLVRQWSPSGHDEEYSYEGNGGVTGTYTVDYSIPFVELSVAQRTEKLKFDMSFGASTLVHVRDEDVHLIRVPGPIYNSGSLSGNALKFVSHLQYDITPHVFIGLAADYIFIRANGMQHQHIDAGSGIIDNEPVSWNESDYSIKERVLSQESCFTFNVGFRFGK